MRTLYEALEAAFAFLGGVPRELLFDQLKTVVIADDRLQGGQLVQNAEFLRFADHDSRFGWLRHRLGVDERQHDVREPSLNDGEGKHRSHVGHGRRGARSVVLKPTLRDQVGRITARLRRLAAVHLQPENPGRRTARCAFRQRDRASEHERPVRLFRYGL